MMQGLAGAPELFLYPLLAGLLLAVLQIVLFFTGGLSAGHAIGDMIEGTHAAEWFDWLNLGQVPFSILVMLLLVTFGAVGIVLSGTLPTLPDWAHAFVAAPLALGLTKVLGNGIATILPRDESYAVNHDHMIGRRGVVTVGPLDDGHPGNVRVRDAHGELHTIRAVPVERGTRIEKGADVVVVSAAEDRDRVFLVIPLVTGP